MKDKDYNYIVQLIDCYNSLNSTLSKIGQEAEDEKRRKQIEKGEIMSCMISSHQQQAFDNSYNNLESSLTKETESQRLKKEIYQLRNRIANLERMFHVKPKE